MIEKKMTFQDFTQIYWLCAPASEELVWMLCFRGFISMEGNIN